MRKLNDGIDWIVLAMVLLFGLTSCFTQKKAVKQLGHINYTYPELIASNCAALFPVVARPGVPVIKYIPAENTDYTGQVDSLANLLSVEREAYQDALKAHQGDTSCQNTIRYLQSRYDSLYTAFLNFKRKYVPCKPDTLRITKTDTIPDLAAIAVRDAQILALKADRDKYKQKYEEANDKAKKRLWYLIGIGLAAAGYTVLKIKRILP